MKNSGWDQIRDFLSGDKEILVVTHFSPDGDAVGSLLAMGSVLEKLKVPYVLAVDDPCPKKYQFLPGFDKIINLKTHPLNRVFRKAVILDAGAMPRIGDAKNYIDASTIILNIDHHYTGAPYGHLNLVNVDAAATAELLFDLCNELGVPLTPQICYGLYVGFLSDTGRFRFSNTNAKVFRICADLVERGVNPSLVTEHVFFNMPLQVMKSLSWGLSNLELHARGMLSILTLDLAHFVTDTEDFVEFASSLSGVAVSAFIAEMEKDVFKVSIRSRCRINVSDIAKRLNGGGHLKAAGFRFEGRIEDLKRTLVDEVKSEIIRHKLQIDEPYQEMPPDNGAAFTTWTE